MNRLLILFILCFQLHPLAYAQPSKQQKRNLMAFSKLFGYVRYFYPADELQNDSCWNAIAIYGIQRMLTVKNDKELIAELRALFCPLVPQAKIDFSDKIDSFTLTDTVNNCKDRLVYWQHQGFGLNSNMSVPFRSIRVNSKIEYDQNKSPLSYFSVTKVLQLEKYKGKPFVFTLDITAKPTSDNYKDNLFAGPCLSSEDLEELNTERKAIAEVKESFIFRGTIDRNLPLIQFGCYIDPSVENVQINSPQLFIRNSDNKLIPIDLDLAELIDFSGDLNIERTKYAFMIGKVRHEPLFNREIKAGEVIRKELVSDISVLIPLSLYSNGIHTYPVVDSATLDRFQKKASVKFLGQDEKAIETRLACLIQAWNVLKHSFPYWKEASAAPDSIFERSLEKAFFDVDKQDFLSTLQLLTVPLNDGQMYVDLYNETKDDATASVPLLATSIDNRIFVKMVMDQDLSKRVQIGDEIMNINGRSAMEYLREKEDLISGSQQWKRSKGLTILFNGPKHSSLKMKLRTAEGEKRIQIPRSEMSRAPQNNSVSLYQRATGWINKALYYVDLTSDKFGTNPYILQEMDEAKAIIFDMRGYPPATISSAQMLNQIQEQLTTSEIIGHRIYVPQILYPDYQNVHYKVLTHLIHPAQKRWKAKAYFLTDANAISVSETYLSVIKDHKLGTIIGQATAGADGAVNILLLPHGYRLRFSGTLVKTNTGSKHYLVGVIPDIEVKPTLEALKERRDEILERAIELAEQDIQSAAIGK